MCAYVCLCIYVYMYNETLYLSYWKDSLNHKGGVHISDSCVWHPESCITIGRILIAWFNDCSFGFSGQIANLMIVMVDPIPYNSIHASLLIMSSRKTRNSQSLESRNQTPTYSQSQCSGLYGDFQAVSLYTCIYRLYEYFRYFSYYAFI